MHGKGGLANQEALNREAWQSRRPQTAKLYTDMPSFVNSCDGLKHVVGCLANQEALNTKT